MDMNRETSVSQVKDIPIEGYWIPATPVKPSVAKPQQICAQKQDNQPASQANWLEESEKNSQDGFSTELSQGAVPCCAAAKSQLYGDNVGTYTNLSVDILNSMSMPFGDLLALADPTTKAGVSGRCNCFGSIFNSRIDDGHSISSGPSSFLNSPIKATTDAGLSKNISQFAPATPDHAKMLVSDVPNLIANERTNQARDEQEDEDTTKRVEINEIHHAKEALQLLNDQSCAAVSTQLLEDHNTDKCTDLNETAQQKPRRKRHRPKVVIEGKPKRTREPRTSKPADPKGTPTGKRKYVRKKGLDKPPINTPTEENCGTTDPKALGQTAKSCKRSLNFDFDSQVRDESSSCRQSSNFDSASHAQNICARAQSAVQLEQEVEERHIREGYQSMSDRQAPSPSTPSKTDDVQRDNLMVDSQNARARGKCQMGFSDETHDKEVSSVQMMINSNTHSAPRSPNNSNCCSSIQLAKGKQTRVLKREHSNTTDKAELSSIAAIRAYYNNSLQTYLASLNNDSIPGVHFPGICKKKRTEKGRRSATSSTLSTVTATQNRVRRTMAYPLKEAYADAFTSETNCRYSAAQFNASSVWGINAGPPGMVWKDMFSIDALVEQFRHLDIGAKSIRVADQEPNALFLYNMRYQEQNALVLYQRDGTVVPFEGSFNRVKKRRSRPKVDLDDETNRVWKLLLQDINSEGIDGTDDKAKWWEEERRVFQGRADSFIARMHLVQGDRRFSKWKGSVVDSVVGVFLTQNVSDHLSSSAFMSLAAQFPLPREGRTSILVQEPEVCVLDPDDTIRWHEDKSDQSACDQSSMMLQDVEYNEEKVASRNECKLFAFSTNGSSMYHQSAMDNAATQISGNVATFMAGERKIDNLISPQNSVVSSQSSVDSSTAQTAERTGSCSQSSSEVELIPGSKPNSSGGSTSFVELLRMAGTTTYNQDCGNVSFSKKIGCNQIESIACDSREPLDRSDGPKASLRPMIPHLSRNSRVLEVERFDMLGEESRFSGIPNNNEGNCASEHSELSAESVTQATVQKISSSENNEPCHNLQAEVNKAVARKIEHKADESNLNEQDYLLQETFNPMDADTSSAKRARIEEEKRSAVDWDSLRKQAQTKGNRERPADTMDSVDWEAIRNADVNEIANTIRERGMNNRLAERIKDFLDRLVTDHESIDLEWLRDVPPDKAKEYLLSIRGLGLKSVECVRLLTLHHLAFPVDTNVGRIAVRLGWVPLQPLPESLQLHLLELYPMLESIQKFLWPRLCKLDQRTLYELHYQMITFGKVFCTKSKPNCNACPMRGECRHFASAFASARLALPAPEEKGIVSTNEIMATDQSPVGIIGRLQLPPPHSNQQMDTRYKVSECVPIIEETATPEPIIEVPASPEPESTQISESDIEDTFCKDPEEIPTIKLNIEEFTQNLQNYMQQTMELREGDMSKALVALTPEAASIPMPKLKNVNQLRTEHQVYELPDSHPLLEGLDKREPDDPCPYLLAIWTPGENADSIQPPEGLCSSQESGNLCNENTCFSCNNIREANSLTVRGTLLIPCRTAMRGSFPLNGTYFQVNEVFADHESSLHPIDVPRAWIWNLPRRTVYFGTSIPTIFRGLSTEGIQYCFWRGFVCVRGFDQKRRAPRPLMARLHFPASKLSKAKGKTNKSSKHG